MSTIGGVVDKLTSGIKERIEAVGTLARSEVDTVKKGIGEAFELKPVPASKTLSVGTIDNVAAFVVKQAEITRRWVR